MRNLGKVMEEILHQLVSIFLLFIYKVLYIPGGFLAGFLNHQQYNFEKKNRYHSQISKSTHC